MLLDALADLLFPRACVGCGAPPGDAARYFCWNCLAGLEVIRPPFCRLCGDPADGALEGDYLCAACRKRPPEFDRARSALRYRGVLRNALQEFKYRRATWLSRDFAMFLAACWQAHAADLEADLIGYVPLFPAKERERSFNQAGLLARDLGARLGGLPVRNCLARLRPTPTQTHLTAEARRDNVRGVFGISGRGAVAGRRVLLIDDVMTTGATVNECAGALKAAGADKVYVLTVARG